MSGKLARLEYHFERAAERDAHAMQSKHATLSHSLAESRIGELQDLLGASLQHESTRVSIDDPRRAEVDSSSPVDALLDSPSSPTLGDIAPAATAAYLSDAEHIGVISDCSDVEEEEEYTRNVQSLDEPLTSAGEDPHILAANSSSHRTTCAPEESKVQQYNTEIYSEPLQQARNNETRSEEEGGSHPLSSSPFSLAYMPRVPPPITSTLSACAMLFMHSSISHTSERDCL
jgi:hypothetical protein